MRLADATLGCLLVTAACAVLAGCGDRAVLDLRLDLPRAEVEGAQFVVVQARDLDDLGFETVVPANDAPRFRIDGPRIIAELSIVTEYEPEVLGLRVRYCRSETCTAPGEDGLPGDDESPELRFTLEHPLYLGEKTYWEPDAIEASPGRAPVPVLAVDACAIRGCIEGVLASDFYCEGSPSRHFCAE